MDRRDPLDAAAGPARMTAPADIAAATNAFPKVEALRRLKAELLAHLDAGGQYERLDLIAGLNPIGLHATQPHFWDWLSTLPKKLGQ